MNAPTPGWQPDPTRRHEYRYWDGGTWTDDVSDNGVTSVDPFAGTGPAGPASFGGEPTAPMDPSQSFPPQPGGFGPPGGAQPGFGPPPGTQSGGFGAQPGPPGYGPYGSGQMPPGQPRKSGPPVGLIVALAVVALAVVGGLVLLLTNSDDDDETSTEDTTEDTSDDTTDDTTGPEDADVFSLEVGDCLNEDTAGSEVGEVPLVPCEESHVSEIYYSHMIDTPDLPDSTEMEGIVTDVCLAEFESFVGMPYEESVLEVTWLEPTQGSWESGDRELLCMVVDPSGPVTGSLAGANR